MADLSPPVKKTPVYIITALIGLIIAGFSAFLGLIVMALQSFGGGGDPYGLTVYAAYGMMLFGVLTVITELLVMFSNPDPTFAKVSFGGLGASLLLLGSATLIFATPGAGLLIIFVSLLFFLQFVIVPKFVQQVRP